LKFIEDMTGSFVRAWLTFNWITCTTELGRMLPLEILISTYN